MKRPPPRHARQMGGKAPFSDKMEVSFLLLKAILLDYRHKDHPKQHTEIFGSYIFKLKGKPKLKKNTSAFLGRIF